MKITVEDMTEKASIFQKTQMDNSGQDSKAKETATEMERLENTYDAVSDDGDTLRISEAGKNARAETNNPSEAQEQNLTEKTEGTAVSKGMLESAEDGEEDIDTTDLSQYTKTELKQLYYDGDITKVEYEEELASRG